MELLSSYFFNLYNIKGKDMVLSEFLSRQKSDDSNHHETIPISFSLRRILCENYYRLGNLIETPGIEVNKYLVQTRAQTKSSGIKVPEVHGVNKGLILHIKPEHQQESQRAYGTTERDSYVIVMLIPNVANVII